MYPVLLHLGPLTIYSFGAMMAIAFLTAGFLTSKEMERKGLPPELASTLVVWAAVGGIGLARLWLIFEDLPGFFHDPIGMVFSGSGFVWYGGLVGGTLAVTWVILRSGLPWLKVVDCIAPALVLAHAIGRVGCQLAGDGDWGVVSNLPWAMAYPHAIIGWNYPPGVRVHPTPVYECLAYTGIFCILWAIRKRPHPDGTLFWLYLVLAPAARFAVEFVRTNRVVLAGLTEAQIFSLILMAIGAWRLWAARGTASAPVVAGRPKR
jgi:phosphatidylglycerol---prolipoprotein diacylglyceryl transferase